ncbi:3D domain-containing protein [Fervidibacter sacchari]|uniref:3D domain-containing protein n=1 Tax=Candidatus Fervidibacter sacchari TaxID=1448929 RepID=UPI0026750E03|nr:3D domain-containing protein [Candidatus Fervidibacter sacchari]WKU18040.1 3D domain-containing protein [Candidatus Fervidibacter sacchari]
MAVDPRVIPLGTALYVDRYGFAIAADTGRKIKGARIDLCFPAHREAMRFGTRSVRVLILR